MTRDDEVLDLALTLARKYEVSLWQVYMTYLQHLFDSDISTNDIKQCVEEKNLVEKLGKEPKEFISRMEQTVLLTVSGCDHERLLLYYTLIEQCGGKKAEAKAAASHIKLLKKLKGSAKGLNYKLLLKPDTDVMALLRPVLTAQNVNSLANMAKNVPTMKNAGINPSTVYCAWAQKYFFNFGSDRKPKTVNAWITRFNSCEEYMEKMNPSDVTVFVKQLILSSEGARMVPLEARMEYCQKVIKFSNEQEGKEQVPDDGRKWKEVAETAKRWRGHLDLLRSSTFLKLQNSEDQILRNYANKFAMSGGSEEPLRALACRVLLEGSSTEVLQEVLSVYPEEAACTPEDVMLQALRIILNFWKNQNIEVAIEQKELCEYDMMEVLDHILSQIASYLKEGGELLSEEEVLQDLRSLGEDVAVPLKIRVEALSLAEKHLSLSEEDLQVVCVLRTGNVVARGWLDEDELDMPLDQVSCSEGRKALLSKLITHTKTLQQAQALIDLLKMWPPFGDDEYQDSLTNPWLSVFRKIIEATKENDTPSGLEIIWEAAQDVISQNQLPKDCLAELVQQLCEAEGDFGAVALKYSSKVALLSDDPEVNGYMMKNLSSLLEKNSDVTESRDYDGDLLARVITRGLVAQVAPTPLYGPLVTHLTEIGDKTHLREAVEQLESAGFHKEAASLTVMQSSIPKALQTISSVLKTYKNWL